jgi:hypothetical protein
MTTTAADTIQNTLNEANPTDLPDAIAKLEFGDMLLTRKEAIVQVASATVALATAASALSPFRRGVQPGVMVRVTGGAAAAGARLVTDVGGTPSATVCTLSDDGKTLVFENTVTDVVIAGQPRPAVALTDLFAPL